MYLGKDGVQGEVSKINFYTLVQNVTRNRDAAPSWVVNRKNTHSRQRVERVCVCVRVGVCEYVSVSLAYAAGAGWSRTLIVET